MSLIGFKAPQGEALICCDQPATAEMLYGASGKLVGIGSSFP